MIQNRQIHKQTTAMAPIRNKDRHVKIKGCTDTWSKFDIQIEIYSDRKASDQTKRHTYWSNKQIDEQTGIALK